MSFFDFGPESFKEKKKTTLQVVSVDFKSGVKEAREV